MELFNEFIWPFHAVLIAHVLSGSVGLIAFWVPVVARKGDRWHRNWGVIFSWAMLITGSLAMVMASLTLFQPVITHPHLAMPPPIIKGIFGWMMLYLGFLTINLSWYGRECVRHKRQHTGHLRLPNMLSQALLMGLSVNCLVQGWLINQVLMMAISIVGIATVVTNLRFMLKRDLDRTAWLREHLKGQVGAGISVYTAFMAFGAVRLAPQLALNPIYWGIPLSIGLGIIFYHWIRLLRQGHGGFLKWL
jgi:hypothetical protein